MPTTAILRVVTPDLTSQPLCQLMTNNLSKSEFYPKYIRDIHHVTLLKSRRFLSFPRGGYDQ